MQCGKAPEAFRAFITSRISSSYSGIVFDGPP